MILDARDLTHDTTGWSWKGVVGLLCLLTPACMHAGTCRCTGPSLCRPAGPGQTVRGACQSGQDCHTWMFTAVLALVGYPTARPPPPPRGRHLLPASLPSLLRRPATPAPAARATASQPSASASTWSRPSGALAHPCHPCHPCHECHGTISLSPLSLVIMIETCWPCSLPRPRIVMLVILGMLITLVIAVP